MNLNLTIALIFGASFFIQSIFGFGGGFIAILVLSMIIPMHTALGMVPFVINIACLVTVLGDLRLVQYRPSLQIFLKSLPGIFLAGFFIKMIPGEVMILLASCLILLYCLYSLSGKVLRISRIMEIPLSSTAGFIGLVSGVWATYVPVMRNRIEEPEAFRTSILFLWVCFTVVMVPIYISNGMVTKSVIISSMWSLPAVLLASWLGRQVLKKIKPEMFSRLLLFLLIIISLTRMIMLVGEKMFN